MQTAIVTGDPATVNATLSAADAKMQVEVEKHRADLADVQDARASSVALIKAGSSLGWAPAVVSTVVLLGFLILSFTAMKPELTGVRADVTLFLPGTWSGYAGAVVTYWLGSSGGGHPRNRTNWRRCLAWLRRHQSPASAAHHQALSGAP